MDGTKASRDNAKNGQQICMKNDDW